MIVIISFGWLRTAALIDAVDDYSMIIITNNSNILNYNIEMKMKEEHEQEHELDKGKEEEGGEGRRSRRGRRRSGRGRSGRGGLPTSFSSSPSFPWWSTRARLWAERNRPVQVNDSDGPAGPVDESSPVSRTIHPSPCRLSARELHIAVCVPVWRVYYI